MATRTKRWLFRLSVLTGAIVVCWCWVLASSPWGAGVLSGAEEKARGNGDDTARAEAPETGNPEAARAAAAKARPALTLAYQYAGRTWTREEIDALEESEAYQAAIEAVASCRLATNNTPWAIMHGLLAFGQDLLLYDPESGEQVNALRFLCDDRRRAERFGYLLFQKRPAGIRVLRGRNYVLQDHTDQLLMILGRAGVPLDWPIVLESGETYSAEAVLAYSLEEIHKYKELPFALGAYCAYLPDGKRWRNKYGTMMNVSDLAAALAEKPVDWGPCFGTHRLYSLAICLGRPESRRGTDAENWAKVRKAVDEALEKARTHQGCDGTFNIRWWEESRPCGDDDEVLHVHGHVLSWLAIAGRAEDMPWIDKSARHLLRAVLTSVPKQGASYSWLAHAADGLKLYMRRKELATVSSQGPK